MYKSLQICNSHAYGGSFLREPSMACNINGIGIANSKKYNPVNKDSTRLPIKLSTGALPCLNLYYLPFALLFLIYWPTIFFFCIN